MHALLNRNRVALVAACVVPVVLALVLVPFREHLANTDAALAMVVVIVAVAAGGYRRAGILAALVAAVSFDFFLTRPYERLNIDNATDVETAVLLLVVGIAVTELAVWGRRQQALASRKAGFLAGIEAVGELMAKGGSRQELIEGVSDQLVRALNLRKCHFEAGVAGLGEPPRLQRSGQVMWKHAVWDVGRLGLPDGIDTELLVENGGRLHGRFLLTPVPQARISLADRRVAVTLADQVGGALG